MNGTVIKRTLLDIAHARSGDKGNHANIGVIARRAEDYEQLRKVLTKEVVADFFARLAPTKVERFELPGIHALNFLLYDVLDGGASQSLRIDSQGKLLCLAILEMELVD